MAKLFYRIEAYDGGVIADTPPLEYAGGWLNWTTPDLPSPVFTSLAALNSWVFGHFADGAAAASAIAGHTSPVWPANHAATTNYISWQTLDASVAANPQAAIEAEFATIDASVYAPNQASYPSVFTLPAAGAVARWYMQPSFTSVEAPLGITGIIAATTTLTPGFHFRVYSSRPADASPEFAVKLRQGPINRVMNTNTLRVKELARLCLDATPLSGDTPEIALNLNGYALLNLAASAASDAPARKP